MRRARDVALPAVVASRAMARAKVQQLDAELAKAGLLRAGRLLGEHDAAARRAVGMLRAELGGAEAAQVEGFVAEAADAAAAAWARRMDGKGGEAAAPRAQWAAFAEDERVAPAGGAEEPLGGGAAAGSGPFGSGDDGVDALPERPGAGGGSRLTVTGVQRQLSILVDNSRLRRLVEGLEAAGRFSDMRRLQELRDPSVDHSWVRRLDFCEGPVLREDDYSLCLQLRLGASVVPDSYECPECGGLVDCRLSHSTCCAKAERTKGHYAVVRAVFERMREVDSGASLEQRGLVEAEPGARPGDIFTTAAVPNREAAVDVTIVSPEAAAAGSDCVATAHRGKFARYRAAVAEWGDAGPRLQPLVWSCEGRAHPDVERVMAFCAKALARRASTSPRDVLRRWRADIGALAARRARMARRCLPAHAARASWVVHGLVGDEAGGQRAALGALGDYLAGADEAPAGE